jgi:hypothetical protein
MLSSWRKQLALDSGGLEHDLRWISGRLESMSPTTVRLADLIRYLIIPAFIASNMVASIFDIGHRRPLSL